MSDQYSHIPAFISPFGRNSPMRQDVRELAAIRMALVRIADALDRISPPPLAETARSRDDGARA